MIETITTVRELRENISQWRRQGEKIVLVATMGNLHAGHLSLVEKAKTLGERVVVTIFVNPTQFVEGEDFDHYPRTLESDLDLLQPLKADLVFVPGVAEVYPNAHESLTQVSVPSLDGIFCGASRPGHFTGVATVVSKLFNLVQPDCAIFGEKDYQQLLLIRRMVADLNLPIEIVGATTIRENDGLAMSSRNQYLTREQRIKAPFLYQILREVAEKLSQGVENYRELEKKSINKLENHGFMVDYLSICNADDLSAPENGSRVSGNMVILAAVLQGKARLIDNVLVSC